MPHFDHVLYLEFEIIVRNYFWYYRLAVSLIYNLIYKMIISTFTLPNKNCTQQSIKERETSNAVLFNRRGREKVAREREGGREKKRDEIQYGKENPMP